MPDSNPRGQRNTSLAAPAPRMIPVPSAAPTPANEATDWGLASYKIRRATKTAMNSWVRRQQSDGKKITIGGQVDEILTAWLKTQGVELEAPNGR